MPINYKDYHPKWSLISRLIRFVRAGNKCEKCGAINYEPHPVTGSKVVLTVAHLDQDRTNNRFWNLAALCQKCHLGHDLKQHVFNRKYGRQTKYLNGKLFLFFLLLQTVTTIYFNNLSNTSNHMAGFQMQEIRPTVGQIGQKWGLRQLKSDKTNLTFLLLHCYKSIKILPNPLLFSPLICNSTTPKVPQLLQTVTNCYKLLQTVTHILLQNDMTEWAKVSVEKIDMCNSKTAKIQV